MSEVDGEVGVDTSRECETSEGGWCPTHVRGGTRTSRGGGCRGGGCGGGLDQLRMSRKSRVESIGK